jgi:hypothetical protein
VSPRHLQGTTRLDNIRRQQLRSAYDSVTDRVVEEVVALAAGAVPRDGLLLRWVAAELGDNVPRHAVLAVVHKAIRIHTIIHTHTHVHTTNEVGYENVGRMDDYCNADLRALLHNSLCQGLLVTHIVQGEALVHGHLRVVKT